MTTKSVPPRAATFRLTALAGLLAIAALAPLSASALGLGSIRVSSPAGQPLKAEVDLVIDNRREALDVVIRNGSAEEYERQGLGPRGALAGLRVAVQQRGKKYVAVLTTREPLNDPYAYIVLEGSAGNGHVMRSYPVLLRVESLGQAPAQEMRFERSLQGPITAASLPDEAQPRSYVSVRPVVEDSATKLYENLIEIGDRPKAKQLHRVSGMGKQEPVGQALFRIVPKGWKGFAGEVDVRAMPPINWAARNDYWISVLDGVMSKTALTATVNWPAKEVTFRGLELPTQTQAAVSPPVSAPEPVRATVRPEPDSATKLSAEEVEKAQVRVAALKARLAYLEEREAAQKAAKASPVPAVELVAKKKPDAPVNAIVVQPGNLSLDTAIRNVLPSNYLLLANDQGALQRPRVKAPKADGDWLATVMALVASQGGTVRVDHEKQRVFVSLTS